MPMFTIRYDLTERTVQEIDIEAEDLADAIAAVATYEFDNSNQRQVESHEWSIDNVRPGVRPN